MKSFLLTWLLLLNLSLAFAQNEAMKFKKDQINSKYLANKEFKNQLIKHDFSSLLIHTDNSVVYGFISDNYQRIRIKFITVTKDAVSPDTYHIYGKSMVKNNVDDFRGTIKILNIRKRKRMSYGVDNEYKNKGIKGQFVIIGDYSFAEAEQQDHSGSFNGIFKSDFYLDKGNKVHYDDIQSNADGYTNNQFIGQWTDYKNKLAKKCNWGDFRVPNSGDLDIGAGEFSPNEKYLKYGWQSLRDHDEKVENSRWWK